MGRNKDRWPPGTGVSLQLGMVALWDLMALLTQQCHVSPPITLVYSAALVFLPAPANAGLMTLSYGVLLPYVWFVIWCGLQAAGTSVGSQCSLPLIPSSSFPVCMVEQKACVKNLQITATEVTSTVKVKMILTNQTISLQLRVFFTEKWNTLSFGVDGMCTPKIWKHGCRIAEGLTEVSVWCRGAECSSANPVTPGQLSCMDYW